MKYLTKNKHWEINKEYDIDKILYLLIDRPNYINTYIDFQWINNENQYHRNYDLPAYVCSDGDVEWLKNNKSHRENNKPAIIRCDGSKEYYINNKLKT